MTRSAVGLAMMAIVVLAPAGAGAVLCASKKGAVAERPACRKKERVLDLGAVGAAGPPGEPGAPGASHPRLRALDATGAFIGYVSAFGILTVEREARVLQVEANAAGFVTSRDLFFTAPACTGVALVGSFDLLFESPSVRGTTAYYAGEPIVEQPFASFEAPTEPPPDGCTAGTYDAATGLCCFTQAGMTYAGPAMPIALGTFTSPFRVEVAR
jgi:hypothetical protein